MALYVWQSLVTDTVCILQLAPPPLLQLYLTAALHLLLSVRTLQRMGAKQALQSGGRVWEQPISSARHPAHYTHLSVH